jgi:hypothetical protein
LTIQYKGEKRALSPRVQEVAQKVFEAYDKKVAKEFDPDLPEWRMPGKATLGLVAIAAALYACGPVTPSRPTETLASPTVIVTETYTPTITNTPTVTATRTETAIPTPEFYPGIPPNRGEFVRITQEQAFLKAADILAHPELTGKPKYKYGIETDPTNDKSDIFITGWYGDSVLIDTGATIINPDGGPDMDVLFIEFLNPDGTNKVAIVCIDGMYKNIIEQAANNQLSWLQKVEKGQALIIEITTTLGVEKPGNPFNPAAVDLTDKASDTDKALLKKLWQSGLKGGFTGLLPDGTEKIILYGSVTVSQVPQPK